MKIQNILLSSLILLCIFTTGKGSLWNQLTSFTGEIQIEDFSLGPSNAKDSKFYLRPYQLTLLSDLTFEMQIEASGVSSPLTFKGECAFKQDSSLNSNSYELKSSKIKGKVTYETGWGVSWDYKIELKDEGLKIERHQVKYSYLNIILMVIFGISGLFIFSISDRARVKILYNLRKRTHPIILMLIVLKAFWVLSCFIIIGYNSLKSVSIWAVLILYGVYLFTLSPSIIHVLYLISAAQRGLSQIQSFKSKTVKSQLIITLLFSLLLIAVFFASFTFGKDMIFFYVLSLNTVFMYIYSCRIAKFAYGPLIIYDIILSFVLSMFCLYLPIGNFILVSYKQVFLFWNYFLFLFAFGMIFMKKFIKNQMVQQIQLQQYSTGSAAPGPAESERRNQENQNKPPQSSQLIDQ